MRQCCIASWSIYTAAVVLMLAMIRSVSATANATTTTTTNMKFLRVEQLSAADPRPLINIATAVTLDAESKWKTHGKSQRRVWQMFFEWLNNVRGGVNINGTMYKVQLTMVGDNSNTDRVRYITKWLCDEGVRHFFAPYSSGLTRVAAEEVTKCGAIMIAPNAGSTTIFNNNGQNINPMVFGTTSPASKYVIPAFEAVGTMVSTMAIFYEENTFSGIVSGACSVVQTQAARFGISYQNIEGFDRFLIDTSKANYHEYIKSIVKNMSVSKPDFVLGCVYAPQCDDILKAMENLTYYPKSIASLQCVTAPGFLQKFNNADSGRYVAGIAPWMTTMELDSDFGNWSAVSFSSAYKKRYGEMPSYQAASAWAAAEILMRSMEMVGSLEPVTIANVMKSTVYNTVFGRIAFDQNRQSNMDFKIVQFFEEDTDMPRVVYPVSQRKSPVFYPIPLWSHRPCFDTTPTNSFFGYVGQSGISYGVEGSCTACPEGMVAEFNNVTQKRECNDCPSNLFKATDVGIQGKTFTTKEDIVLRQCIKNCPAGSVAPDQTDCEQCTPGSYQLNSTCQQCLTGKYTLHAGQTVCTSCANGTFANATGQTGCFACPPGKANSQPSQDQCEECPIGKYATVEGRSACVLCEPGMVANTTGLSECVQCVPGRYSVWGALECALCSIGKYQPDPRKDECKSVVTGAAAPRPGMTEAENDEQYWARKYYNVQNSTTIIWELCKFTPDACLQQERCNPGNTGVQCQTCIPGYSRDSPGIACWSCWSRIYYALVTFIVVSGLTLFCLLLAYLSKKAADRPQDMHSIILKLLLNHIITMNVVSMMLQEIIALGASDLSQEVALWSNRIRMSFDWGDGTIPAQTKLWSVECLLATFRSTSQQDAMDVLYSTNHSYFMSNALAPERETLKTILVKDELVHVAFWFLWPFLLVLTSTCVGCFWLQRSLARDRDNFRNAIEFYRSVNDHSFSVARKKLLRSRWVEYVRLYFHHMNDLFWPARHARKYLSRSPHLIDFRQFWKECQPIRSAVFFISFGSSVRGAARALKCVQLEEDGSQVYLYRSEVVCNATDSVFLVAAISMLIWAILYPLAVFIWIKSSRKTLEKDGQIGSIKELNYQWGLFLNGYKSECWYWEVVVFMRKGSSYMLYAAPFQWWSEEGRILCYLVMALGFACLHVGFDPYERRSGGLLSKIEGYQLAIWILSVILMKYIQASPNTTSAMLVPFSIAMMHYAFVIWLLKLMFESICTGLAAGWDHDKIEALPDGWRKTIKMRIIEIPRRNAENQPTVTMDHLYGWVSAYNGAFKDGGIPSVPKGKFADRYYHNHRPPVSLGTQSWDFVANKDKEPGGKGVVAPASGKARTRIQDAIQATMYCIINSRSAKPVVSVSLLDFIIRGAFTLNFEEPAQGTLFKKKDDVTEVPELTMRKAMKNKDPIKMVMDEAGHEEDDGAAENEAHMLTEGARMEEHLSTDRGLEVILTPQQLSRQKKKAHAAKMQSLDVGDQDEDTGDASAPGEKKETRESREAKMIERRLAKRVELMYSSAPYRKELSLEDLQLKLLQIQHTPPEELAKWLDIFEFYWGIEKAKNADELRYLAGNFEVGKEKSGTMDENGVIHGAVEGIQVSKKESPREISIRIEASEGASDISVAWTARKRAIEVKEEVIREIRKRTVSEEYIPVILKKDDESRTKLIDDKSLLEQRVEPPYKLIAIVGKKAVEEEEAEDQVNGGVNLKNDELWMIFAIMLSLQQSTMSLPMLVPSMERYFEQFKKRKRKEREEIAKTRQELEKQFAQNGLPVPGEAQLQEFARMHNIPASLPAPTVGKSSKAKKLQYDGAKGVLMPSALPEETEQPTSSQRMPEEPSTKQGLPDSTNPPLRAF